MKTKKQPRVPPQRTTQKVGKTKSWSGSQTLVRGLDVLEAIASGVSSLAELEEAVRLNRSTAHRLAATLVERRYLTFASGSGYGLGAKSLELGYRAKAQLSIPRVARDHLEKLAAKTHDTVHLGVLDENRVLYLDKLPGNRRIEISSRVGERQPVRSTGLGKALLLDEDEARLREFYRCENGNGQPYQVSESAWMRRMGDYAKRGYAFDMEENEDRIRCVAAPLRDATGEIKAALSVSSAAQYMNDARMEALVEDVCRTAKRISRELGWDPPAAKRNSKKAS
jgi:DNA-binding IclR family transcriptional regulator